MGSLYFCYFAHFELDLKAPYAEIREHSKVLNHVCIMYNGTCSFKMDHKGFPLSTLAVSVGGTWARMAAKTRPKRATAAKSSGVRCHGQGNKPATSQPGPSGLVSLSKVSDGKKGQIAVC